MSKNNEHAGMHFIYRNEHIYDANDYDRYAVIIGEQMEKRASLKKRDDNYYEILQKSGSEKKKERQKLEQNKNMSRTSGSVLSSASSSSKTSSKSNSAPDLKIRDIHEPFDRDRFLFNEADYEYDKLWGNLFLSAIKNHAMLSKISMKAAEEVRKVTRSKDIDPLLYFCYCAKLMGSSMRQVAGIGDREAREILFVDIISKIKKDPSMVHVYEDEFFDDTTEDCAEYNIVLMNYSDEDKVMRYYAGIILNKETPYIDETYNIVFHRYKTESGMMVYYVTAKLPACISMDNPLSNETIVIYDRRDDELNHFIDKLLMLKS